MSGLEALLAQQIIGLSEAIDDEVASLLVAGTGISLSYNDGAGTLTIANTGLGGSTGSTDNRILRSDGTGGATVQASGVTLDGSGNISGLAMITSTRAGSLGAVNPQNQIILYGGFSGYGIGFNSNGELATVVNSVYRSSLGTNIDVGLGGWLRFNSASGLAGSWDTQYGRNATGPSAEIRAAGGLIVNNAAGSANAAFACGAITASGVVSIPDGSAGSPGWRFASDTDTGMYRTQNNTINVACGGTLTQQFQSDGSLALLGSDPWMYTGFWAIRQGGSGVINMRAANGTTPATVSLGTLNASALVNVGTYTVGTLPSAASNAGALAQVTDSSITTNGSTVAGGGSNRVPVFSDGTNWIVK